MIVAHPLQNSFIFIEQVKAPIVNDKASEPVAENQEGSKHTPFT
jgi:hypothetical protein